MTLRLPLELREAVTEEARVKGDLARIVLFALSHVKRKEVEIQQTRKAGLPLCSPQLLHVGAEARTALREWAEEEGVSVNAIVVSVLEEFFKTPQEEQSPKRGTAGWRSAQGGDSCSSTDDSFLGPLVMIFLFADPRRLDFRGIAKFRRRSRFLPKVKASLS